MGRLIHSIIFFLLLLVGCSAEASEDTAYHEEVLVDSKTTGPKMWRITNGTNQLWIIGLISPIARGIEWDASLVNDIISESSVYLEPPGVRMTANPVKALFSFTAIRGFRNNPDKKRLNEILPASSYQQWLKLKEEYEIENKNIEKYRPMFAAYELFDTDLAKEDLVHDSEIRKTINKRLKKHKVKKIETQVVLKVKKIRKTIKAFKKSEINDTACFDLIVSSLTSNIEGFKKRADAWAEGDVQAIRDTPYVDPAQTCAEAFIESSISEEFDFVNAHLQSVETWVTEAENAINNHDVSFAVMDINMLLKPDSPIQVLKDKGLRVFGPINEETTHSRPVTLD